MRYKLDLYVYLTEPCLFFASSGWSSGLIDLLDVSFEFLSSCHFSVRKSAINLINYSLSEYCFFNPYC